MPRAPDMRHDFRFPLHIRLHYDLEKMVRFLLRNEVYMRVINKIMTYVLLFNIQCLNLTYLINIKLSQSYLSIFI